MQTFIILWMVLLTAAVIMAFLGAGQLTARLVAAEKELAELRRKNNDADRVTSSGRIDWSDDSRCFVLAVEPKCLACKDRITEFGHLVAKRKGDFDEADRFIILSPAPTGHDVNNPDLEVVADSTKFGQLAITATPSILTFDADGHELTRTVAGNNEALAKSLDRFELVGARRPQ